MKKFTGIGLMSGTSADGIDLAFCSFTEKKQNWDYEIIHAETIAYDEQWKARLTQLHLQDAEAYAKTNVYYGHHLGKAIKDFLKKNKLKPDFVSSHGHTIFHQPQKSFTAQIGDGETMSAYLDCPLVTNFRNKDVAVKGQGAPLVPFGEKYLFPENKLFLNLGGIANISYDGKAFDCCPCNLVLNLLAQQYDTALSYDKNGELAAKGKLIPALAEALKVLPYYSKKGPKSLGREWLDNVFLPMLSDFPSEIPDLLFTCSMHIAEMIAQDLQRLKCHDMEIVITGGGAHNIFLMGRIKDRLEKIKINIKPVSPLIIDYKEALIFAFLGLMTLQGRSNTLPEVTGAEREVTGGSIHLPHKGRKYQMKIINTDALKFE